MSEDANGGYLVASQQTLIALVQELAKAPLTPRPLPTLQEALDGMSRSQAHRALKNLEAAGWAEQVGDGWRLGPGITLIAKRYELALADVHSRYLGGDRDHA